MRYYSPAKVNLFLRVHGRRDDGYHELSSLFQTISIFDSIDVVISHDDRFFVNDPAVPNDTSNLVMKALSLFRAKTGIDQRFEITLEKFIPTKAGLGGGSSNAATTLWALNEQCGRPATADQLMQWGAEIGSDVPFFFSLGTALCTGRGEKVALLPPLMPVRSGWIVKPPYGLSTPAVYRTLDAAALPVRDPLETLSRIIMGELCYFNDLEYSAFQLSPELAVMKACLGTDHVMMTGSGSAFISIGDGVHLPTDDCWAAPFCFVNRSVGSWYCG